MKPLHIVFVILAAARCGQKPVATGGPESVPSPAAAFSTAKQAPALLSTAAPSAAPRPAATGTMGDDTQLDELWRRADDGESDDLARLADREGAAGILERATSGGAAPVSRLTALRALAYADGYEALPFLAEAAAGANDADASAALESLADIAARKRRATDQEDGFELREGCDAILVLARDTSRPRARRIGAIRFLRMMTDRGCVQATDIPADLDAH